MRHLSLKPYHETRHGQLFLGDCIDITQQIDDKKFDLAVTSPPYDNLREYGEGENYCFTDGIFKPIAEQLFRITKDGGVVVWVVGDATVDGSETGSSFRQALYFKEIGFNLHDTMIYQKSGSPYPDKHRYKAMFEYMFVLSSGKPNRFNPLKEKVSYTKRGMSSFRQKDGITKKKYIIQENEPCTRGNVWKYGTGYMQSSKSKIAFEHPAIFPEQLAIDHIKSWSDEGMLVLDPFAGSGTTAIAAIRTNRRYIMIEKEEKYCEIAARRIDAELEQIDIFRDLEQMQ